MDQIHTGRTFKLVAQNLADAAGRRYDWRYCRRQRRIFQTVSDLLAHEIVVAPIFELQPDETESEDGVRTDVCETWRARYSDLERDGDVSLHLFR